MADRLRLIRKADNVVKMQIADGESLENSPITYLNTATVTATLYTDQGTQATNEDGTLIAAITMDPWGVNSPPDEGRYRGIFSHVPDVSPMTEQFDPPLGTGYTLEIVIATQSGANRTIVRPAWVTD